LPSKEAAKNYTLEIMNRISEKIDTGKSGSNHRIIIKLVEFIKEQYNQNIGLNELADMVNMNPAYLSILFKEEVGMTYIKYLTQVRLNHAKELLQQGYKVTEVSEMVGYNDYHYFSNIFKKNIGIKPNEYKGCVRKK
jgi:two-component system response regulator YesN